MENGKINVSSIDLLIIEDNIFIVIFHVSSARDRQPAMSIMFIILSHKGSLETCKAKVVPSFPNYFRILRMVLVPQLSL